MSSPNETVTGRIRDAVDRAADNIEEIHKAIADLPLEVLERNGLFEEAAAELRGIQDRTLGAVYDVVHRVNARVTELAADLVSTPREDNA